MLSALLALALAQAGADASVRNPVATTAAAPEVATHCGCVPAGTPVELEIAEPISSRDRQRGDFFQLRLHAPLLSGDTVVLPAGTPGVGQIVHADRSRGGGKPGELLLAARYLQIAGQQLPLRGFKLGATGTDKSGKALAASFAVGPFAAFIHGGEIEIPPGAIAQAKLAQDVVLAPVPAGDGPSPSMPAHVSPPNQVAPASASVLPVNPPTAHQE